MNYIKTNQLILCYNNMHRLVFKQTIPLNKEKLWDFISSPGNLNLITPSEMAFEILSELDSEKMYSGQIINYKVSPLMGIKLNWVTEITHVEEGSYFVDEQRFGPYSFWHHKHFLKEISGGVEMIDIIDYKLPFGFIGRLINQIMVKGKLNAIFEFRRKKLIELFGEHL